MQTATADPLVGRLLEGRYRIVDRIARGGMSTVYAAVDERLDRRVAVKVMASSLSADPKFSDRFAREARAAARLTHVNAVAVYDQGLDDSAGHHVFLVMELVEGRTLRDLIRERQGRFSTAEAVSIMEPVLSALSAAHRAGLVHRDVKPENILLSDDGLVKVADFGLARAVDSDAASTRTGLMMGTVAYCAPEQIVHGRSDQRSDVYSAGIVLFELLTGRPPYQGESAMNVAYQHVHSRVPAPSSRTRSVPEPIDEIVVAATDSDPTGRPGDASSFLAEIADARTQLALPIVPIPPRKRPAPAQAPRGPQPNGHARRGSATTPVRAPGAGRGAETDVMGAGYGRHDTELVTGRTPGRGDGRGDAPPPPVVIPPPKRPLSPRARRRRRRLVLLVAFLLLGALSVTAGIAAVRKWQAWNTQVPRVAGSSQNAATAMLKKTGYAVDPNITSEFSETVAKGVVIRTDPKAGTRVDQGKTIRLVISLGKDRVPMPNLAGMSLSAAETTLQSRGLPFDPTPLTKPSITVPQGSVISTDPTAGTQMKRTQQTVFTVSSGPPVVTIPTIAPGTPFDQASTTLQKAKFKVDRVDNYSDSVADGGVISLDPGDKATYGSTVTINVSKGPEFVTIPDYAALSPLADLIPKLDALGIKYEIDKVLGGVQGRVLQTNPAAGAQVRPGDTITITVV